MLYRKVKISDRLPDKEGRYIVGFNVNYTNVDGLKASSEIVFQANYEKQLSFHEEDTNCSAIEWWLEEVRIPTDEEIHQIMLDRITGSQYRQGFYLGFMEAIELLNGKS